MGSDEHVFLEMGISLLRRCENSSGQKNSGLHSITAVLLPTIGPYYGYNGRTENGKTEKRKNVSCTTK